ncbi:prolipoprotein diacylglyceryl transferase [Candidatus Woesearchaeota archaeon]|nr:prolipoprotein diacylglyceryl transferase [Candidatus Woesearchaeota archaeon]
MNNLDPVLLNIGFLQIRWYGLLYALGVLFAYWYCRREIKAGRFKTSLDQFETYFVWAVISMVIGARLFEVFFYQPAYYLANPLKIVAVWEGGLSFHGGVIGIALWTWYWCKRRTFPFLHLADNLIVGGALAQVFGRLGNWFNSELVGRAWNGPWSVIYARIDEVPRHPVQMYEIFYNLVIFGVLFALRKKQLTAGSLFASFLVMYGVARFVVEYFKEPEVMWGFLTIGQWLSVAMVAIGVGLWFWVRKPVVSSH